VAETGDGLLDLAATIRRRWWPILLICLPIVAGATFYAETRPDHYQASAIVSVIPRPNGGGADLVRVGAPKYASYISAPATLRELAPRIGEPPSLLIDGVNAEVAPDTGNVIISAELPTPERAARAANRLANQVIRFGAKDKLLSVNLVARADVPTMPAGPSRRLIEAAGLVLGLVVGVAFAALLERLAPTVRGASRPYQLLSLAPIMGRLPWSKALRLGPEEALADPSVAAAAIDLAFYLEREMTDRSMRVLVVTSPVGNDGKTTIAKLVAALLSVRSDSVLLVDANPANPELSQHPGADHRNTLQQILHGRSRIEDSVHQAWNDRVWILPSSHSPNGYDPSRDRLLEFVRQAREEFTHVVIDTGSLAHSRIARQLATMADGVILVTSASGSAHEMEAAVTALRKDSTVFVGVVVNGVREIISQRPESGRAIGRDGADEPPPAR
jgi:succinoglycan biosynthesis transport protein ExoP